MLTFDDYHTEKMKAPEFKREYDVLEGRYQEEIAKQEAMNRTVQDEPVVASEPTKLRYA